MRKNEYPSYFLDNCIKTFFLKKQLKKTITFPKCNVPRKIVNINIPFMGADSLKLRTKVPINVRSLILYKFSCGGCNSTYLGKSKRHYLVRVFEHLGISLTTGKNYSYNPKNNNNTAVLNHIKCSNCNANLDNFRIIGSARNDYQLCLKESLLIQLHKYNLNTNIKSMPLKLFD